MTQIILLKIMASCVAAFAVFWTADELTQHIRYRDRPHRWQWRATPIENRTADILWISDRFWMVVRLVGALGMMGYIAYVCLTR